MNVCFGFVKKVVQDCSGDDIGGVRTAFVDSGFNYLDAFGFLELL